MLWKKKGCPLLSIKWGTNAQKNVHIGVTEPNLKLGMTLDLSFSFVHGKKQSIIRLKAVFLKMENFDKTRLKEDQNNGWLCNLNWLLLLMVVE